MLDPWAELLVVNLFQHVTVATLVRNFVGHHDELLAVHENLVVAVVEERELLGVELLVLVNRLLQQLIPSILLHLPGNYFHAIKQILEAKRYQRWLRYQSVGNLT